MWRKAWRRYVVDILEANNLVNYSADRKCQCEASGAYIARDNYVKVSFDDPFVQYDF